MTGVNEELRQGKLRKKPNLLRLSYRENEGDLREETYGTATGIPASKGESGGG